MFYACLLNIFFYICINKQTKTNIMKNLTIKEVKELTQKAAAKLGISEYTFNKRYNISQRVFLIKQL